MKSLRTSSINDYWKKFYGWQMRYPRTLFYLDLFLEVHRIVLINYSHVEKWQTFLSGPHVFVFLKHSMSVLLYSLPNYVTILFCFHNHLSELFFSLKLSIKIDFTLEKFELTWAPFSHDLVIQWLFSQIFISMTSVTFMWTHLSNCSFISSQSFCVNNIGLY